MDKKIEIMQHNLVHIRKRLGLTEQKFGDKIGVTKQTIWNIEKGKTKLTKTTYLAILYVMDNDLLPPLSNEDVDVILKMLNKKVVKNIVVFEE